MTEGSPVKHTGLGPGYTSGASQRPHTWALWPFSLRRLRAFAHCHIVTHTWNSPLPEQVPLSSCHPGPKPCGTACNGGTGQQPAGAQGCYPWDPAQHLPHTPGAEGVWYLPQPREGAGHSLTFCTQCYMEPVRAGWGSESTAVTESPVGPPQLCPTGLTALAAILAVPWRGHRSLFCLLQNDSVTLAKSSQSCRPGGCSYGSSSLSPGLILPPAP